MPDQRIKRIDPDRGIYARKDDWVTCENGHLIARLGRTVRVGDDFRSTDLVSWRQDAPIAGQLETPKCYACGSHFVRPSGEYHFYNGWRVVAARSPAPAGWFKKLWEGLTS